jgi:hypothetical protein
MRRFGWLILAAAATACGSSSGGSGGGTGGSTDLMPGFQPGPVPDSTKGFQIVLPPVHDIGPGASVEYCTWTNITLSHDIWIKATQGWQSETGHHVILFYTDTPQPAWQSRVCNDADMASFRFATGAAGEGSSGMLNNIPGDLAIHVPAGAQIVINHHYLNATAKTISEAQSALNVFYADPNAKNVQASSLAMIDTGMSVAPGQNSVDFTCTFKQDFATWYMIPHMHNWGTTITIDHTSASGTKRLFDVEAWNASYAFHPPTLNYDPNQPYYFKQGDQVHVHCDYNNTTKSPLTFGAEMCVFFAGTVDPTNVGNIQCDTGDWGTF